MQTILTSNFVVSSPRVLKSVKCLVLGCPEVAHSAGRLREILCTDTFDTGAGGAGGGRAAVLL